jgi:predicted RNase H-like HicB family nuclease
MCAWRARVVWLEDTVITVTMCAVPLTEESSWVGLKDDAHTVVGSGKTFAEARADATEAG